MRSQNNFSLKKSKNVINNNSAINIDNDSSIANSHQSKFTKDQSISTVNTSVALIITKDIPDQKKIKHDLNNCC